MVRYKDLEDFERGFITIEVNTNSDVIVMGKTVNWAGTCDLKDKFNFLL